MRAIGYARVSTEEQAREGVSIDAQIAKINDYCALNNWQPCSIEVDRGISAKTLDRPGMNAVIAAAKARAIDAVVVYKLDRLTRSVGDLSSIIDVFDKYDVAIVSWQESLDATTASGRLMMNLLASVSQWEREVIGERTKDAMRYLKAQRKAYSRPVFGYDNVDGELIANKHEQRIIKKARAHRESDKWSYERIAAGLNDACIPGKRGGMWTAMTVRRILLSA
jgi:site-specific DNA recombinase